MASSLTQRGGQPGPDAWRAALLERGAPSSVLYLEVEDVRASISVLQGRGVEVIALPYVIFHHGDAALGPAGTDEWMAFIRDSEGNTVGLVSRHPPAVVQGRAPG
ncbi:UNVERIFIED_ORG: methylmalonyl-CoA/ethylmalonyl-CoA epimerase [Arthrobacter sp. UYEF10]